MESAPTTWTDADRHFMQLAFQEARRALERREVPIGCVIVSQGQLLAAGSNLTNETRNATLHAEMDAINRVLAACATDEDRDRAFHGAQLYVTCEPCIMCAGALSLLCFGGVAYGCANDRFGGCGSILPMHSAGCGGCGGQPSDFQLRCRGGLMAEEAVELLKAFYATGNPKAPKPHRLLAAVTS